MTIQIREFKETECELYGPNGFIGTITSYLSLTDVRIQIKKLNLKVGLTDYYFKWKNMTIRIGNNGNLECWPVDFFDIHDRQLDELLDI